MQQTRNRTRQWNSALRYLIPLFLGLFVLPCLAQSEPGDALAEYVAQPDSAYAYQPFVSLPGAGYTVTVYAMTSQRWRTEGEVDRSLWEHWLAVVVPDTVVTDTAMLIVAGGRNRDLPDLDATELQIAAQVAMASGSVVAVIAQVPNQPLVFADAVIPLREDNLVAYSWDKAMDTGDFSWPVYLPMVKSVVRGMDTVQAVAPGLANRVIDDFVIVGFSKRGATAWLTAVVDPRVRAISPGVIDFLNIAPHIEHHYAAYGFYAPAVQPYVDYDIVRRVRTPEGQDLLEVVDPYSYRARLALPKYLINASGDQFFPPDSARFYFKQLPGESLLRYVPNTDHSLASPDGSVDDAFTGLLSWYLAILHDLPRPAIDWQRGDDGVRVVASPPPLMAKLWQAVNPVARDFRRESIGAAWQSRMILGDGNGVFRIDATPPEAGWAAYYLELVYPGPGGLPQSYSTRVFISPDTLPYEVIDPLGDPKGKGYWKHQVRTALTGRGRAEVDAETLAGYFPIPLFDTHVTDLAQANAIFTTHGGEPQWRKARQHCLAVRLNVAHKALGWYTPIPMPGRHARTRLLWEIWQDAHDAYLDGRPRRAKALCQAVNRAR